MDPYVAAMGKSAAPILLDCLHLTHEALPWPDGVEAVPVDTGVARDLAATAYNERRAELEAAIAVLKKARPGTQSLREWSLDDLENLEDAIPAASRRRLRHALTEMTRVKRAADALRKGDAKALGAVLNEGHESLSSDFEASTPAIDAQAAALRAEPGVLGVRLQGAGFGGCLVVLREKAAEPEPTALLEELPEVDEA
jgi:galactokinase